MRPGQAAPEFERFRRHRTFAHWASMRPGQAAPEFVVIPDKNDPRRGYASMRPGQAAPEFDCALSVAFRIAASFNEAGAGCPGIQRLSLMYRMKVDASMRPGQAAPEFWVNSKFFISSQQCFNEAGAGCPGIQDKVGGLYLEAFELQ